LRKTFCPPAACGTTICLLVGGCWSVVSPMTIGQPPHSHSFWTRHLRIKQLRRSENDYLSLTYFGTTICLGNDSIVRCQVLLLFHRHRLRQIPRLIHIRPLQHRNV